MATGCFVSSGRSIDAGRRAGEARRVARLRGRVLHAPRGARLAPGLHDLRGRDRAHPARHRRRADLLAHAGDDGPGDGDDRRPLGRALQPRDRRVAPAGRRVLARADDRQAGHRDARVRGDRARDPRRRAAARRERSGRRQFALAGIGPFPDTPLLVAALSPNMLRARRARSPTASCCGSATRTTSATSSSRWSARAARRPASRSTASTSSPPSRPRCTDDVGAAYDDDAHGPADVLRAAVLPRDDRALGLRRRHRALRRRRAATSAR